MARGTWGGALDPNIFRCTIRFRLGVSKCQTRFHVRDVGIQGQTEQDVAEEMQTQLLTPFRGLLSDADAIESWEAAKLGGDTGYSLPETGGTGTTGHNVTTEAPDFMAAVVSLKSEIRKRYGQGRMFWPIFAENMIDENVLSTIGVNVLTTLVTAFTDHFTGDPVTHDLLMVNAHGLIPQHGAPGLPGYHPEIPPSWYDVLSLRLNTVVTSLRSRKAGVGS
jgi:hypothetical protein